MGCRLLAGALVLVGGCHWIWPLGEGPEGGDAPGPAETSVVEAGADATLADGGSRDAGDGPHTRDAARPLDTSADDAPAIETSPTPDAPAADKALPADQSPPPTDAAATDLPTTVPGTWKPVLAGSFLMGSPKTEPCRWQNEAQHPVTLTRGFHIQTTETTCEQFAQVMKYDNDPASPCPPGYPVDHVTWHEAAAYCNTLSKIAGLAACYTCSGAGDAVTCSDAAAYAGAAIYSCPGYRLPTEAEWEYAYRAGTQTAFYSGGVTVCTDCATGDPNASAIGWYCANAGTAPQPVMKKAANNWNLYDMAGNLREWCQDWKLDGYQSLSPTDPVEIKTSTTRMSKGGSWKNAPETLRAADRGSMVPSIADGTTGFRCVRTTSP